MALELNSQDPELNEFEKETQDNSQVEEKSSEEQISKEVSNDSETSEGLEETTAPQNQEYIPDQETIDLIKSMRGEVGDKRFDGLLAAWHRDRNKLESLQTKQPQQQTSQTESKPQGDDELVEYLRKKFTEKEIAEKESQDRAVENELERVQILYPNFSRDKILKTAIDYSDSETNPISLMTAAKILEGLSSGVNATKTLKEDGELKKKDAAKIAGRSGYQQSTGLKSYNPEKDGGKSFSELIKEGAEELGM